jgi:hypothetical protein
MTYFMMAPLMVEGSRGFFGFGDRKKTVFVTLRLEGEHHAERDGHHRARSFLSRAPTNGQRGERYALLPLYFCQ